MYTIEVNVKDIRDTIDRLIAQEKDHTPILRGLGGVLHAAIARGFENEEDPATGEKWAALSPVTLLRRANAGHTGKILQVQGDLAGSFTRAVNAHSVVVGTGKKYATTMHFGAKQGEFGKTKRGGPIPWGDIPARPILPVDEQGRINAEDEAEILGVIEKAVKGIFGA